jgi:hypothetical protein
MSAASKARGADPNEAWQRHYERTVVRRRRGRRFRRHTAANRRRRLLGLVIAVGALYAVALAAAFLL